MKIEEEVVELECRVVRKMMCLQNLENKGVFNIMFQQKKDNLAETESNSAINVIGPDT